MTSRRAGRHRQRPDLGDRRPHGLAPGSDSASVTHDGSAPDAESDMPATSAECDVEVQSIAAGGDGVARVDNRVIFIPRVAPGDRAKILATSVRGGRFARGVLIDLLRPSPERVAPLCLHYVRDRCGGCLRAVAAVHLPGTLAAGENDGFPRRRAGYDRIMHSGGLVFVAFPALSTLAHGRWHPPGRAHPDPRPPR